MAVVSSSLTRNLEPLMNLRFTASDAQLAWEAWGCNCGPGALAAIMGLRLAEVRQHLGTFNDKRYMSPTMMKAALASLKQEWIAVQGFPTRGLMRIQWLGPWIGPGKNPKWAYRCTHWVAGCICEGRRWVFDINGGTREFEEWKSDVVPVIVQTIRGATGGFETTHAWELLCHANQEE